MLLHKDGGNTDEEGRDGRGDAPFLCGKDRRIPEGKKCRERTDDMQRGADVRVRIEHVEPRDEAREGIVAREDLRPEHLTGGKEEIDNERL